MREIVQINVGSWGVKIGYKYWEMIGQEHMIDNDGRYHGEQEIDMLNTHIWYNQVAENKYVPRCIFVDLDPRTNDEVLSGPLGRHFNQDNFISGMSGTGGNWAKGFYTDGNDLSGNLFNFYLFFYFINKCNFSIHYIWLTHKIRISLYINSLNNHCLM